MGKGQQRVIQTEWEHLWADGFDMDGTQRVLGEMAHTSLGEMSSQHEVQ